MIKCEIRTEHQIFSYLLQTAAEVKWSYYSLLTNQEPSLGYLEFFNSPQTLRTEYFVTFTR